MSIVKRMVLIILACGLAALYGPEVVAKIGDKILDVVID